MSLPDIINYVTDEIEHKDPSTDSFVSAAFAGDGGKRMELYLDRSLYTPVRRDATRLLNEAYNAGVKLILLAAVAMIVAFAFSTWLKRR